MNRYEMENIDLETGAENQMEAAAEYYYAILDENDIVIQVMPTPIPIPNHPSYIEISFLDTSLIGKWYNRETGQFVELPNDNRGKRSEVYFRRDITGKHGIQVKNVGRSEITVTRAAASGVYDPLGFFSGNADEITIPNGVKRIAIDAVLGYAWDRVGSASDYLTTCTLSLTPEPSEIRSPFGAAIISLDENKGSYVGNYGLQQGGLPSFAVTPGSKYKIELMINNAKTNSVVEAHMNSLSITVTD